MKMKNETKTIAHAQGAGRVLRGRGCCLLVVRSVLWCVHLMDNKRTTTNARRRTSQDECRGKAEKTREHRNEAVGFDEFVFAWCFEVIRFDIVSRYVSWYHVPYHAISQDTIYRDINCIYIPIFWDWYRDIVSRRYSSPQLTLFFAQLGAPSLVHQDNSKQNGFLAVVLLKQWYLLGNI